MTTKLNHPESSLTVDRSILANLLHYAAFAAHLVGHLDDKAQPELIRQLGDLIDTLAHELTELLGDPRALAAPDAVALAVPDAVARDGALVLTAGAEGYIMIRRPPDPATPTLDIPGAADAQRGGS